MWTSSVMRWLNEGIVITLRGNKICSTKKALCQAGRTDPAASTGKIPAKKESEINGIHRTGLWVDAVLAKRKTVRYEFFRMCTPSQQINARLRMRNGLKFETCSVHAHVSMITLRTGIPSVSKWLFEEKDYFATDKFVQLGGTEFQKRWAFRWTSEHVRNDKTVSDGHAGRGFADRYATWRVQITLHFDHACQCEGSKNAKNKAIIAAVERHTGIRKRVGPEIKRSQRFIHCIISQLRKQFVKC